MVWILYAIAILVISGLIGMHLGRFRQAYTEMTGMMAGMTMGMLNGFLLGYCAAAATNSMFWGNLVGILLGLGIGAYFGRAGALMGVMDGAMGGVMGGSMGAMLAVMVSFPREAIMWTAVLLGLIYVAGMIGLIVLIEQSAPGHAAFHRLLPMFARAVAVEAAEEAQLTKRRASTNRATKGSERRIVDYYAVLGVPTDASEDEISEAYLEKIDSADEADAPRIERALVVLTNPQKRQSYDLKLAGSQGEVSAAASNATVPVTSQSTHKETTVRIMPQDNQNRPTVPARPASSKPAATPGSNGTGRTGPTPPAGASSTGISSRGTVSSQAQVPAQGQAHTTLAKPGASTKQGKQQGAKASKGNTHGQGQGGRAAQRQQVRYASRQVPAQQNRVIALSWVGGLAFAVLVVALGWWVFSLGAARAGGSTSETVPWTTPNAVVGAAGETQAQLEQQAVAAKVGADGKQTADVVLNSATFQYEPKAIKVKQGVPVRFNLSVINGDPG